MGALDILSFRGFEMPKEKDGVIIMKGLLSRRDRLVAEGRYPGRSRPVQETIEERPESVERCRLLQ